MGNRRSILVTNDDGIDARGIRMLVRTLSEVADIYVCAPATEQSAAGHGLTMGPGRYIDFKERQIPRTELAYAVTGKPADCVKMGIGFLESQKGVSIDYVFSGINHGGNLGTDTVYSGTVSAALEGMICGKSAAAVSLGSHKAEHFEAVCKLALLAFRMLEQRSEDDLTVLNVNVPDIPEEEVKGIQVTHLGRRDYDDFMVETGSADAFSCMYRGTPVVYDSDDLTIDTIAHQHGYATVTPLHHDLTDRARYAALAAAGGSLSERYGLFH
ncbi:MAG: 5'/3'-nucleotidase SurE [Clostridiales bacterium]|nr:5'/3'-nucleotidase SurE [Clostridiales bacterium]